MEIDKTLILPGPVQTVWALLLDPQAMARCVPGMQSVQIVSPDEYTAEMVTKVSFITARMKLRTFIVERDEPRYLKAEGTGEDSAVASSMKQVTEINLEPDGDNTTRLRLKVKVDVVGRLATFGLSALKTKADRLWDEFGQNLQRELGGAGQQTAAADSPQASSETSAGSSAGVPPAAASSPSQPATGPGTRTLAGPQPVAERSWWQRLWGNDAAQVIVVDWQRADGSRLRMQWPAHQAQACLDWLARLDKA